MAKGKLEFDLNDFDDRMSFERCVKSTDMALALWEIVHNTKKSLYYKFESMEEKGDKFTVYDGIDSVFESLYDELNERGIDVNKLIV